MALIRKIWDLARRRKALAAELRKLIKPDPPPPKKPGRPRNAQGEKSK
jgi:hypothetical protein